MVNTDAFELKFFNVQSSTSVQAVNAKDLEWATLTCTLSWATQGIFPNIEGEDVNTCSRSLLPDKRLLATGSDYGTINLFRYPAYLKKQVKKEYNGHASRVTRVKFISDDQYLVSIGGNDKTILVWQTEFDADPYADDSKVE